MSLSEYDFENETYLKGEKVIDASIHPMCWIASFPFVHCGFCPYKTVVTLRKEEVERFDKTLCGTKISNREYGELGQVEESTCCCLVCVDSNLGTIVPGTGCNKQAVHTLAWELKERMKERGDQKQIKMAEDIAKKSESIERKLDLITKHLNLAPEVETMDDR